MGIGGLLQMLLALRNINIDQGRLREHWMFVLIGAISVAIYPLAFYSSMHQAGVTIGTVITIGSAPLLSAIIERVFDGKQLTARWALGAAFGLGGLLLIPVLLVTGASLLQSWNNAMVGLYMILVPMFLGYILFGMGLSRIAASTATTLSLIEPVIAAVLAVVIVGERLPLLGWTGAALIVCCLYVLVSQPHVQDEEVEAQRA